MTLPEMLDITGYCARHFSSNKWPEQPHGLDTPTAGFIEAGCQAAPGGNDILATDRNALAKEATVRRHAMSADRGDGALILGCAIGSADLPAIASAGPDRHRGSGVGYVHARRDALNGIRFVYSFDVRLRR